MEKKGEKRGIVLILLSVIIIVLIISSVSADFSDFISKIKKTLTGEATNPVTLNITVGVPQITTVYNSTMTDVSGGLSSGPSFTSIIINFTAYTAAGAGMLNHSTARINFTKTGENTRENLTCALAQSGGNYANYTCNVTMWWWDAAGTWNIAAYIADNNSNSAQNTSAVFQVGSTTGFEQGPSALTWAALGAGDINKTSTNDPLLLNNTGNVNISVNNIQINATNLRGETDNTKALWAGNFSVAQFTGGTYPNEVECNATAVVMNRSVYTNITGAILTKGNYTVNNGATGQEQLYFCLKIAGSELTSQAYSTVNETAWTVQI